MMRLIKRGLMFGNLIEISSKPLVARYNQALKHLTGKETQLSEFHIDISGFSPEIGHELGDELYLNPNGCNQQFILMSTDQKTAPLLNSNFSTSRTILKDFIEDHDEELFALTAREAVTGELMNSVFHVDRPADLMDINAITIEADTVGERIANAEKLEGQIDRFMREEDAWWDDVLIAQMIELAKQTGNIQRHPISLEDKTYAQGNYYSSLFGGVYVFRDVREPAIIAHTDVPGLEDVPIGTKLTFDDRQGIAKFLYENGLIDLIVTAQTAEAAAIIRQKLDFIVIATAAERGADLSGLTRQQLRRIERRYIDDMPEAYHGLMQIWRWASQDGSYPQLNPKHDAYFYAFRAQNHHDKDLVNMLLAELSPLDFRQLFICHKEAFYATYQGWTESKKDYVAQFLEEEYAMDKAGAREALFGPELSMLDAPQTASVLTDFGAPIKVRWKK